MNEELLTWVSTLRNFADVGESGNLIAELEKCSWPQISEAEGELLTKFAHDLAKWAIAGSHAGVITAIAGTEIDQLKAGLVAHCSVTGYTPACLAAYMGNDAAITELADTGIEKVLTKRSTHRVSYCSPADIAAHCGKGNVIQALAETQIPDVLKSLAATNPMIRCTPAHTAAIQGNGEVVAALARIKDTAVKASLTGRTNQGHLAHIAAGLGHASVIEALATADDSVLRNTLSIRFNSDGPTPAEMAATSGHAAVITALAQCVLPRVINTLVGDFANTCGPAYEAANHGKTEVIDALAATEIPDVLNNLVKDGTGLARLAWRNRHEATVEAIEKAVDFANKLPRDERVLLQALHDDLAAIDDNQQAQGLITDTQCFITAQPFATVGPRRPVYLHDQKGVPDGRHCISHSAMRHLMEGAAKNPFTNLAFTGFAEAPDRVALIRDLVETCRQNPDATPQDRVYKALSLYKAHSESAAGVPRAEQPVPQYETVLAAAAGAGARPPSRRAAEP